MFKALIALIYALPELIKLFHRIMDSLEAANKKEQLKKELKDLNEAIDNGDTARAVELFNQRFSTSNTSSSSPVQPHKD